MAIQIDGIIFSLQRHGGISVYFRELIERLHTNYLDSLVTIEAPTQSETFELREASLERRARIIERYRTCRVPEGIELFHSSYYRRPSNKRVPSVVTVHDFTYERFVTGPRRLVHLHQKRAAIRNAQSIICISDSTKRDLFQFIGVRPDQEVHVIYNGASPLFRPKPGLDVRPFVLYVGDRRGYKNFDKLVSAMKLLPQMELRCVGGGPLSDAELHGADPTTARRIKHLGFLSDEQLNDEYNSAICFAYPSSYEGFGIPVVEAMRAGCPVVSIAECSAVIEVGRDALTLANTSDGVDLAAAILRTTDTEHRQRVIERGLQLSKALTWDETFRRTVEVYESVIAKSRRA